MNIPEKDEKYIKDKLDTIIAIVSGLYLGAIFAGQNHARVDPEPRNKAVEEIEKIIYQIYKRRK